MQHIDPRETKTEEERAKYETEDARLGAVITAGIVMFGMALLTALAIWWLYRYYEKRAGLEPEPTPLERAEERLAPPKPRLQTSPTGDLTEFRLMEDKVLGSYGWVDQEQGIVRIPIEHAIELTAQRGLPSRDDAATTAVDSGSTIPLDSSSGRTWDWVSL